MFRYLHNVSLCISDSSKDYFLYTNNFNNQLKASFSNKKYPIIIQTHKIIGAQN